MEFAEARLQHAFDKERLEDEASDEVLRLRRESETLKEQLMQYWKHVSSNVNEEFEEILQMGVSADSLDILSALQIIHEAKQEQEKVAPLLRLLLCRLTESASWTWKSRCGSCRRRWSNSARR